MFSSISAFLRTAWEIAGQFPAEYGGIGAQEAESPLAITIRPAPSNVCMSEIWMPKDVVQLILRKLSPEELGRICTVCKVWNEIASRNSLWNSYDLREIFPKATFITKEDWETYIDVKKYGLALEQKGRPCVDKADYIALKRMESQVEGGKGLTIMTLLQKDKLSNVEESAAHPKAGNPMTFRYFSPHILERLGEVELPETVTVAMTNNVFIGSRNKTVAERKQIVEDLKCEVPGILAATRLGVLRFCMSLPGAPVRLFSDNPWTFTLCIDEKKDESTGEAVEVISHFGGFALPGPCVRIIGGVPGINGVAGLRKFKAIGP